MITGYLAQKYDVHLGNKRVERVLADVCWQHHVQRKSNILKILNPIPYRADCFRHKCHMDQNEKLVMYGVTHVLVIEATLVSLLPSRQYQLKIMQ